ncbi:phage infection protein [Kurthia zopfii]|uniref:Membrane protein n=1 Tax=Kurthia zopfii TaxID=1650 RepID=A0A8B4Q6F7_9BACL|nr:YhgE/Pip domain-containing protein [Kurthia zopfii]PWI21247.1 YhgE/Pip domain-containing protein [Kurthia zopfii]TDR33829.1 putative membrane protein [Kurthia zopfii]GEK32166.1 phage infection protein [Kurthia zopfii]STX08888.1 YhgE/Pip C-terminal domain [Kurthia zopfii]
MKHSWNIFKQDIKQLMTNWVSAVIIGGLIVLPSLYAWLNIAASWDPYGQTSQIPVGIVNQDEGGVINDQKITAGDELVKSLQKNKDMDWQFVNHEKAMDELENGDLFAVIVIPKNFSEKLSTVTDDEPEKAQMQYYVNEKINSIAPKITSKGASTIVNTMSSEFIGTVNGTIFELFNNLGVEIQNDMPDIKQFEKFVYQLEKDLPGIHDEMKNAQKTANEADQMLKEAKAQIPEAQKLTAEGLNTVTTALAYVNSAQKVVDQIGPRIDADIKKIQQTMKDIDAVRTKINNTKIDTTAITQTRDQLKKQTTRNIERLETIEQALTALHVFNKEKEWDAANSKLEPAIKKVRQSKSDLQTTLATIETIEDGVTAAKADLQQSKKQLDEVALDAERTINHLIETYQTTISPDVNSELATAKKSLTEAQTMLTDLQTALPKAEAIMKDTSGYVHEAQSGLKDGLAQYPLIKNKVDELANKLRKFDKEIDLNKVVQLLLNDPNSEKSFFEEPIQLKEHALFPIKNYGTGMTPFYAVLSLWVGALLLISLLSVGSSHKGDSSPRQIYLGKLFTFWTIGICQALIMSLGTIFIIGVEPANPVYFVLFCVFSSLVFMSIVYTLVSLFGDVGKALAIVLLVLQLAGAGGTYPVVLLPKFFQIINPFLPFTYAIEMVRESVGGIIWSKVGLDVLVLSVIALLFIAIGLLFKKQINKYTEKLLKKSRESGLFH